MSKTREYRSAPAVGMPAAAPDKSFCNVFDTHTFLNCMHLYYARYGAFPNMIRVVNLKDKEPEKFLKEEASAQAEELRYDSWAYKGKELELENVIYIYKERSLIIDLEGSVVSILYGPEEAAYAQQLGRKLAAFRKPERKPANEISVLVQGSHGLELEDIPCPRPKLKMELHYNDDLAPVHENMMTHLKRKSVCGLYLLHGIPGTGKSTYLRYLVNKMTKRVIFLSPRLAGSLDTPSLVSTLLSNTNSILIVEDAEDLLSSREQGTNSAISTLLNLTDGILGESLGIQIICTFNTHVSRIDRALLRKGRLIAAYEFKALEAGKAGRLLAHLGKDTATAAGPMTLAEIFGQDEADYGAAAVGKREKIGFGKG